MWARIKFDLELEGPYRRRRVRTSVFVERLRRTLTLEQGAVAALGWSDGRVARAPPIG
jgi:hypothetical protein